MKFIIRLLLLILICYFVPIYAPWWSIFIGAFLVGFLIPGNGFIVFNAGFLGGGIVWLAMAFFIDYQTDSILSDKLIEMFPVDDTTYLVIAAGLIGAFCTGFGALTGNSFRQIFIRKKQKSFYS